MCNNAPIYGSKLWSYSSPLMDQGTPTMSKKVHIALPGGEPHLRDTGHYLSYGITPATWHKWTCPSIYLSRRDGRLSWPSWLHSVSAGIRTSDLSIMSPTPNHCTTKTPNYTKIFRKAFYGSLQHHFTIDNILSHCEDISDSLKIAKLKSKFSVQKFYGVSSVKIWNQNKYVQPQQTSWKIFPIDPDYICKINGIFGQFSNFWS